MSVPLDKKLYAYAKHVADQTYKKPSAYKSGFIVRLYKKMGGRYATKPNSARGQAPPLKRWFDEKWQNQRGEVGYRYKSDVYRPTVRVNKKTPKTFAELSDRQVSAARKKKAKQGRVDRF